MTAKKTVKKSEVVKSEERAVAVKQPAQRRMAWGGITPQVGKSETDNQKLAFFCNQVAVIYGVPSTGVNAMSGQPYLNKDGRLYLLNELRKGKNGVKAIRKEFLQMSTSPEITAIVKVTIVFKDGTEYEAIGEASRANVKLEAVKATLNMMAETRARNRAIWEAIGGDILNRVAENLAKAKGMSEEEKNVIVEAGRVSYEEMQSPKANETFVASEDDEIIADLKEKVDGALTVEVLMEYGEKLMKSKASKKVKDEVSLYIQEKVAKLTA